MRDKFIKILNKWLKIWIDADKLEELFNLKSLKKDLIKEKDDIDEKVKLLILKKENIDEEIRLLDQKTIECSDYLINEQYSISKDLESQEDEVKVNISSEERLNAKIFNKRFSGYEWSSLPRSDLVQDSVMSFLNN